MFEKHLLPLTDFSDMISSEDLFGEKEFWQMGKFIISTDTTADLTEEFIKAHDIDIHPLFYLIDGTVYGGDEKLSDKEFYSRMRSGSMPTTMATNPDDSAAFFRKRIEQGYDIIHIAFSSGLSSSYNNAVIAKDTVKEEYPDARIAVIDSLAASMGEGLLVYKAIEQANEGKSFDEIVEYVENTKLHISHQFTVDDLNHLYRGGRVSKTAAIIGSIVGIKPVLHVNDEGKLIPTGKVRGRKKSLLTLVDYMEKSMGSRRNNNNVVFISHGDSLEDAMYVGDLIKERLGISNVVYNTICPTIAAHSGPGTIALFFEADNRYPL